MTSRVYLRKLTLDRTIGILSFFALSAVLLSGSFHWTRMRPVSDDYCFAASMNEGVFAAFGYWYQNVQFDFFVLFSNLTLVAVPIRLLPPNFASIFSLIFMICLFSFFLSFIFLPKYVRKLSLRNIKIVSATILSFITFFFLQSALLNILAERSLSRSDFFDRVIQHSNDISNSWAFWGVVNSSYLIPFILSLYLLLRLDSQRFDTGKIDLVLAFLVGTSGYVIAATTCLVFLSSLLIVNKSPTDILFKDRILRLISNYKNSFAFVFSIALGVLFSFSSPGAFARREVLGRLPSADQVTFQSLFQDSALLAGELFLNVGNLVPFFLGFLISRSIPQHAHQLSIISKRIFRYAGMYFFIGFFFTMVSEMFSYRAFWHSFTLKYCLFVLLVSLGISSEAHLKLSRKLFSFLLLTFSIGLGIGVMGLSSQVTARYESWASGTDYGALASIDSDRNNWVNECFRDLQQSDPKKYYPEINK